MSRLSDLDDLREKRRQQSNTYAKYKSGQRLAAYRKKKSYSIAKALGNIPGFKLRIKGWNPFSDFL